jgi:hypothetical protein
MNKYQAPKPSEILRIVKETTHEVKPIKTCRYSSTEEYLLHRIAELEEEVEMLKTLYMRGELNESKI